MKTFKKIVCFILLVIACYALPTILVYNFWPTHGTLAQKLAPTIGLYCFFTIPFVLGVVRL